MARAPAIDAAQSERVKTFIAERQARYPNTIPYYQLVWDCFNSAGLAGSHFIQELTSGNDQKFFQRVWEMLLARHLLTCGHNITSRPQGQPDFCFEHAGKVIWIEAVSPARGCNISPNPPETEFTVPHTEILLRWTTALHAKIERGRQYREKGVLKPNDAYIIAIDGSQIGWFPLANGASHLPYCVEAVFPIGPLAFRFIDDRSSGSIHTPRYAIEKRNQSLVNTSLFLDRTFSGVCGVIGCVPKMFDGPLLPLDIVYNPLSNSKIEMNLFGSTTDQWTAKPEGGANDDVWIVSCEPGV